MTENRVNELGQPIGAALENWSARPVPERRGIFGRSCQLSPLDPDLHAKPLYEAMRGASEGAWTYLPNGPYASFADYRAWQESVYQGSDPLFYAVIDSVSQRPVGVTSYLRIKPQLGVIEVGNIHFSPLLQRQTAATEALFLMMQHALDTLGYRRFEWKCDALNAASRKAALRLGFSFEGIFRQHTMYKGRSRDTAWFAILDAQWPALKLAYTAWLDPNNFDASGQQKQRLNELIQAANKTREPSV